MGIAFYIGVCIVAAPFLLLTLPGYWRLFKKAGRPGWEVLIPVYSTYAKIKISGRPAWWLVWVFVPGFNFIAVIVIYIDFIKSYGKFGTRKQLAAVFFPFIYILKWGFDSTEYLGPYASIEFQEKYGKPAQRPAIIDWGLAVIGAFSVLIFIRLFIIESYVATSPSMERSLLTGDCFFVSKLSYGSRLPMRPVSIPFVNDNFAGTSISTYWDGIKIPYLRLPGFGDVKRGDVVVFNYPMDADSPYYRPVDKRTPYLERCIAIPGDTFSMVNAAVYINGKKTADPAESQIDYKVEFAGADPNPEVLKTLHISKYEGNELFSMTAASAQILRGYSNIKSVTPNTAHRGVADSLGGIFPLFSLTSVMRGVKLPEYKWNIDNFSPIVIPKKGWTVTLDSLTIPLYERVIEVYENNTVKIDGSSFLINGKKANNYTFKMNYYWMMGDNRHDSLDSRFWGFVPEDHIIGKAVTIWTSSDENEGFFSQIRWERIMKRIR